MSAASYESILHLADLLTREEKLRLIRELTARTTGAEEKARPGKDRSILELSGLGAETWNGIDAQEYVRSERASWNG
jgi:hypothetical protein